MEMTGFKTNELGIISNKNGKDVGRVGWGERPSSKDISYWYFCTCSQSGTNRYPLKSTG